ncbi:Maf family protein [Gluconacetobacter entanii]|uniref:Nucleoside triphosphate pyrophosphatase n=1 Tax=Gluconacetobacter entanii TaxID=108528 RepID=A0ABT3K4P5_9PROT|nr:Maf family protein [Gluconacetobacter entanii]MCW4590382.1 Maf family protein [Gluconacetobacter entanii]MCW4594804.1 Maf family protein [Gluconacetobacter entanii]NPC89407.1 Maf-like protein [Gluconacetobacter entanii]
MTDDSNLVLKAHSLQAESPRIVLASQSAARRGLLESAGLAISCQPASVDEATVKRECREAGLDVDATALTLARAKAARIVAPDAIVIGADQMLSCNGEWFDKPEDLERARAQLMRLRGQVHVLHTAVVVMRDGVEVWRHIARPCLWMRNFSEEFLDSYLRLEGDAVLSCVGAYRLEGPGLHLFARIEGDHDAILGLPVLPLLEFLREQGTVRT